MKQTNINNDVFVRDHLAVSTKELQKLLSLGYSSAYKIGELANAKIMIGKRVLWNLERIKDYLDEISMS